MKIVVPVKQVPVRDASIHVSPDGKWLQEQDLSFEINEPGAYALEEALLLKEKHGGEVVVLCAGPDRAGQTIREALAKGADRTIHIASDDLVKLDTFGLARMLADAIRGENADLILTGLQSDDLGLGQTGVVMGIPHATIIMEVEKLDGTIRVKRELEDGWFQWVELPLPDWLTIQWDQQTSLRHGDGIQEGEKEGWSSGRCGGRLGLNRTCVFATSQEGITAHQGLTNGGGVLVVLGDRNRLSGEALAADQELENIAAQPLMAAVIGDPAEATQKKIARVYAVEHPPLKKYTADGFMAALEQLGLAVQPAYLVFSAHVPSARLCTATGGTARTDADCRHRRYACRRGASDLRAAPVARQADRGLSPFGRRAILRIDAGWYVSPRSGGAGELRRGSLSATTGSGAGSCCTGRTIPHVGKRSGPHIGGADRIGGEGHQGEGGYRNRRRSSRSPWC